MNDYIYIFDVDLKEKTKHLINDNNCLINTRLSIKEVVEILTLFKNLHLIHDAYLVANKYDICLDLDDLEINLSFKNAKELLKRLIVLYSKDLDLDVKENASVLSGNEMLSTLKGILNF